jgi:hypothetical protein
LLLSTENKPIITGKLKWDNILDNNYYIDWDVAFTQIYKDTIDTKLREFQFKVLHRILPTNKLLVRMHKTESNLCNFCNSATDSIEHYLWFCDTAQLFGGNISEWLAAKFKVNIKLNISTVLKSPYDQILNYIILLAKYFLHCCKWKNTTPNLNVFLQNLLYREKLERNIAIRKQLLETHEEKWKSIL